MEESPLLRELECPVCKEYFVDQVHMCVKGHSVCVSCKVRCEDCPLCKAPFGELRNVKLERLLSVMKFPCRFRPLGCFFEGSLKSMLQHQEECIPDDHACPVSDFINCLWRGSSADLKKHLQVDIVHRILFMPYNTNDLFTLLMFQYRFNALFKIYRNFSQELNIVKWVVMYLGPPYKARYYRFKVEFTDRKNKNCDVTYLCDVVPICNELEIFKKNHIAVKIDSLGLYQQDGYYPHQFHIFQKKKSMINL